MSYTYTSLDAPQNPVATPAAGGDLAPDTTYYFRVYAMDVTSTTYIGQSAYGHIRSDISAEFSATTDSTNKTINLSWDAVTGANSYCIHVTTSSSGATRWESSYINGTGPISPSPTVGTNSYTFSDTTKVTNLGTHTFIYDTNYLMPGLLDRNKGEAKLSLSGTVGSISFETLLAQITDSSMYFYDGYNFVSKVNIDIASGTTGTLNINSKNLISTRVYIVNNSSSFTLIFNNCDVGYIGWFGGYNLINATFTNCKFRSGGASEFSLKNVEHLWTGSARFYIGTGFVDGGYNFFYGNANYMSTNNLALEKAVVYGTMRFSNFSGMSLKNSIVSDYIYGDFGNRTVAPPEFREIDFRGLTSIQDFYTYMNNNSSYPFKFYDNTCTRTGNIPQIRYSGGGTSEQNECQFYFSGKFIILDEQGNPIENVTIKILNSDGDTLVDSTTDSSGELLTGDMMVLSQIGSTTTGTFNWKTPFSLTVSKSGYKTYRSDLSPNKKFDEIITLSKVKDINLSSRTRITTQ